MIHYSDVIISAMASRITSLTSVYSTVYSGADQRKHQSSASLLLAKGIHLWPANSLHIGSVTQKVFPFDDVILAYIRNQYSCLTVLSWVHWCEAQARGLITFLKEDHPEWHAWAITFWQNSRFSYHKEKCKCEARFLKAHILRCLIAFMFTLCSRELRIAVSYEIISIQLQEFFTKIILIWSSVKL